MFDVFKYPYCASGHQYALDITAGKIPASIYTIGTCLRYLRDIKRSYDDFDCPFFFDPERAERYLRLVQKFEHVSGQWETSNIVYMPWQNFIWMNVKGFIRKDTNMVRFRTIHVEVARGNAKAHPLDQVVPTPEGFKKWGDIEVGSKLYARDGSICTVIHKNDITRQKVYKVKFSDGSEIECSNLHEWIVSNKADRVREKRHLKNPPKRKDSKQNYERVEETINLMKNLKTKASKEETNYSIKLCQPIEGSKKNNTGLNPYFLGYWYGNGNRTDSRLSCSTEDASNLCEYLNSQGLETYIPPYSIKNGGCLIYVKGARNLIRKLGLVEGKEKLFLEEIFLWSIEERLEVLRGLLDSGGYCSKEGFAYFSNPTSSLVQGAYRLLCSLGYKATVLQKEIPETNNFKPTKPHFAVSFFPHSATRVFNLKRKYERQKGVSLKYSNQRYIVDVVETETYKEMFCVEVDSIDHSYLIGDSYIPTHNSTQASQCVLYDLCLDSPKGNHIYCAATRKEQARLVLDASRAMAKDNKSFLKSTGVNVLAHQIVHEPSNSYVRAISAEAQGLDGKIGKLIVADELHAMRRDTFEVLDSGQSKRRDSQLLCITTAGYDTTGVGYSQSSYAKKICLNETHDDTFFALVYTIDEGDDPFDPKVWVKANPGFGVIVDPVNFEAKAKKAKENPADLNGFLIKHLNVWTNSSAPFFDVRKWDLCYDPDFNIEDYYGSKCWAALDLASKIDLTSMVFIFKKDEKYVIWDRSYVPKQTIEESRIEGYREWEQKGFLISTPGEAINLVKIQDEFKDFSKKFRILGAMYDPWNATEFASRMSMDRIEMLEFKMTTANLSEPMKKLDALIREGKIIHNGSPLLRWCLGNVVAKRDHNDNVFPRKEHKDNKIDPIVAMIMAMAGWIQEEEKPSVYTQRDMRFL